MPAFFKKLGFFWGFFEVWPWTAYIVLHLGPLGEVHSGASVNFETVLPFSGLGDNFFKISAHCDHFQRFYEENHALLLKLPILE